jgi:hypothetical protein
MVYLRILASLFEKDWFTINLNLLCSSSTCKPYSKWSKYIVKAYLKPIENCITYSLKT